MWQELGLNMVKHDKLLAAMKNASRDLLNRQPDRPAGMEYFDNMLLDLHGIRVRELLEHKKNGGKVVGTFCLFAPEEIVHAADAMMIKLEGGTQYSISNAETILPFDICPMVKSFVGAKLGKTSPYFEVVDFLIGETTCDAKKKVWEILNIYVPTYVMELPQKKTQPDRDMWLREITLLKEKMEIETGVKISSEKLANSIKVFNAKRKAMRRLHLLRKNNPPPISGRDAHLVSQIAGYDDPQRFTGKVNELCDELEKRIENRQSALEPDAPRIMISGCPMALPNWKIHNLIETSGAVVIAEDTCLGARYFMDPLIQPEDSTSMTKQLKATSERYLNIACPCFTPGYCSVLQMSEIVEVYRPAGMIYYVLQFCHGFNIEFYKIENRLKEMGIPVLKIQTDYSEEDTGQLSTRIEAFFEMISVRKYQGSYGRGNAYRADRDSSAGGKEEDNEANV
jgi:benzoyl-CoA reductase/2-hydroxyglutaryl-CoA dehydratase subunit BcrC/BadD/HgdB